MLCLGLLNASAIRLAAPSRSKARVRSPPAIKPAMAGYSRPLWPAKSRPARASNRSGPCFCRKPSKSSLRPRLPDRSLSRARAGCDETAPTVAKCPKGKNAFNSWNSYTSLFVHLARQDAGFPLIYPTAPPVSPHLIAPIALDERRDGGSNSPMC